METQVLIIGGGATGTGLARDLALRGVHCILVEMGDINSGASGANHGLLHSGARYVAGDGDSASECRDEGELLKRLAPHCIEDTGGLFVAVEGDDERYVADFPGQCEKAGVPVKRLDPAEAREMEPVLSDKVTAAFAVEDATIDPFKLSLENMGQARDLGSAFFCHTRVTRFEIENGRIVAAHLTNTRTGEAFDVAVEQVINAAGAWSGEVAAMAGAAIEMFYAKGSLVITHDRIAERVINRLRPPGDADILVPGGTVSILGTTSTRIDSLTGFHPTVDEVDYIVEEGAAMVPSLETVRYIRAYAGVRPLISAGGDGSGRGASRGFSLLDHEGDGLSNFATITGGKLTTYRLMAEKAADLVCRRLGVTAPCRTRTEPFPETGDGRWTQPGFSPRQWFTSHAPGDVLLCECEMVPRSAVDAIMATIRKQKKIPSLREIGLRSRVGKGPCQGSFCGIRIAAHMYERGELRGNAGIDDMKEFFAYRWGGQRPIFWGTQLSQAELAESLHCGLFGLELTDADDNGW